MKSPGIHSSLTRTEQGPGPAPYVYPNKFNVSIQILYPLIFTFLLFVSIGINLLLTTISHINSVESLVSEVHFEIGKSIDIGITNYFDIAANAVGDMRSVFESNVLDPYLRELRDGVPGNGLFYKFSTLYLKNHPEIADITIANDNDFIHFVIREGDLYTYTVRNSTTAPDAWTHVVKPDGNFLDQSEVVRVRENYAPTARGWYQQIKRNPLSRTGATWTRPFLWWTKLHIGMFCGAVIADDRGRSVAVVGTDIVVSSLSQFFRTINLKGGTAFVLAADGTVFTSSIPGVQFAEEAEDGGLILYTITEKLDSKNYSHIIDIQKELEERLGVENWYNISISGTIKDTAVFISPIKDKASSGLHLLVMLPVGPFRDGVRKNILVSSVVGSILLVCSAAAAITFSITMTRPISRISSRVWQCVKLDFDDVGVIKRSWFRDIAILEDSTEDLMISLRSFSRFIPAGVVKVLKYYKTKAEPELARTELAIFFCQLHGLDVAIQELPAVDMSTLLCDFLGTIGHHLESTNATMDKFLSDGVMAFWGAPEPILNRSHLAMESIVRIEKEYVKRVKKFLDSGKAARIIPTLRIGVHEGTCLVGNVGTPTFLNYTAIGMAVGLASRLSELCERFKTTHLVTDQTVNGCPSEYITRRVAAVAIKESVDPVTVVTILSRTSDTPEVVHEAHTLQSMYEVALDEFTDGNFATASRLFKECSTFFPTDGPSQVMRKIASSYAKSIPDEWRGYCIIDK